ncbi:MAG TPA: hypothetical protein VFN51_01990 [Candidatus Saccharimonadales bacterium]|nr:hypothetical protein [Candidatus Saccharimonadales bacterium]
MSIEKTPAPAVVDGPTESLPAAPLLETPFPLYCPETQVELIYADMPSPSSKPAYDDLINEGGQLMAEAAELETDPEGGLGQAIDKYRGAKKKFLHAIFVSPEEQTDPWVLMKVGSCITREAVYAEQTLEPLSEVQSLKEIATRTISRAEEKIMRDPRIPEKNKALGAVVMADALFQANSHTTTRGSRTDALEVAEMAVDIVRHEKEDTLSDTLLSLRKSGTVYPLKAVHELGNDALKEVAVMAFAVAA